MSMNKSLSYILFALRNLPKFTRLCVQLLEEWYKLEHCENDKVGVI